MAGGDTTSRASPALEQPAKTFSLAVSDAFGAAWRVRLGENRPPRVLVGKGPACELRLEDPLASRRHAAIDIGPQQLRLVDLGSTNGTLVNGVRVVEAMLRGGEAVRIGATTLRVEVETDGAPPIASTADHFGRLLGASPEMRRLHGVFLKLAAGDVPSVIEGETGTGKELLAESIHEQSARSRGPFVVVDCATLAAPLLEAELFGQERDVAGSGQARRGAFEQAHRGTLLLDEIGDLDVGLQAKVLRAIERSEIRRVGGSEWLRVDARVIASTRRDLDLAIQKGRFRDDLFMRLAVGRVELPPLRARRGDVSFLAERFWSSLGGQPAELPGELVARLEEYAWPGNVRELRNAVARQAVAGEVRLGRAQEAATPPAAAHADFIADTLALDLAFPVARDRVHDEFERRYVERILTLHGGSVARAAAASGVARRYFQILRARSR